MALALSNRFYSEPGYATTPVVAHAAVSGGAAAIPAPPLGVILLDPRSAIPLGSITVPASEGIARLRFPIPPDPRLVGRQFYFQALIAQGGSVLQWRLTNAWAEQVR